MIAENQRKRLFVSTIPKAGTYFIAEFLEQIGYGNTGYHVSVNWYQDTKKFDLDINATLPSKTVKRAKFVELLEQLHPGQFAFGHINPLEFPKDLQAKFHFIYGYRTPRATLLSEFIDFRFRRKDVDWLNRKSVPDDRDAFEIYLKKHGPIQRAICASFIAFHGFRQRNYTSFAPAIERVVFYNFDTVVSPEHGPAELVRLTTFLGDELSTAESEALHEKLLQTRTKTSSRDLLLDQPRDMLWNTTTNNLYDLMGFPTVEEYIERHMV